MGFMARAGAGWQQEGCRQIDSTQALELIRDRDALVVDVREPHEFAAGRIPNAELIPLREIGYHVENLRRHGDRPIILSCRTGGRSETACRFLRQSGIKNVFNLAGGLMGWLMAGIALAE